MQETLAQLRAARSRIRQRPLLELQARGGITRRAADVEEIARPAAGTTQRHAGRHEAEHLHADAQRTGSGIAADERQAVLAREPAETAREAREPRLVDAGKREAEQRPCGPRAHRREVAQIHRERAVPDGIRGRARGEMHAGDERIQRRDQLLARRAREQRGVVADAEAHVVAHGAAIVEETIDERELSERHARSAALSARAGAARAPPCRARR